MIPSRILQFGAAATTLLLPQVAAADYFTLRAGAGHPSGPTIYVNLLETFFIPEVKRRVVEETEHEVEFIEGYGGSLASVSDTLEAVQTGLLDIGAYCFCFEPSKLFIHNFPYYVPFGPQDGKTAMKAVRATYDAVPWLTETFEREHGQILLGLSGWDSYHLGTKDPWDTIADLQGVKIGGAGPNLPWLEHAGIVPVQSTLPDGYMNMQTGVYNGWLMFPSAYLGYKYYEPSPNYTLIGFGAMVVNGLTVNAATMARLPADVQQIIREVGREYETRSGVIMDQRQAEGLRGLAEQGAVIKELPASARAEWAQALADFPKAMAQEANSRSLPGSEVMQTYIDAVTAEGQSWLTEYKLN